MRRPKRLYMTATPRIYGMPRKPRPTRPTRFARWTTKKFYGREFHRLGFGKAVERDLLTDYKVLILAVGREMASRQHASAAPSG